MRALRAFAMAGAMMWSGVGAADEGGPVYPINDEYGSVIPVLASVSETDLLDSYRFLQFGKEADKPYGHVAYCKEFKTCDFRAEAGSVVSDEMIPYITTFNTIANHKITGIKEESLYNKAEFWRTPITLFGKMYGDCEDYVLYKREVLESMGIPRSAMSIAAVEMPWGEGHAVLIVRSKAKDLVLDNLTDELLTPYQTPYEFIKATSWTDDSRWQMVAVALKPINTAQIAP